MLTAIAPPTAALPLIASAPETARFCSAKLFVALTVSVSVESTFAPTPIFAVVSKSTYMTPIDAATPTSDFPLPAGLFGALAVRLGRLVARLRKVARALVARVRVVLDLRVRLVIGVLFVAVRRIGTARGGLRLGGAVHRRRRKDLERVGVHAARDLGVRVPEDDDVDRDVRTDRGVIAFRLGLALR